MQQKDTSGVMSATTREKISELGQIAKGSKRIGTISRALNALVKTGSLRMSDTTYVRALLVLYHNEIITASDDEKDGIIFNLEKGWKDPLFAKIIKELSVFKISGHKYVFNVFNAILDGNSSRKTICGAVREQFSHASDSAINNAIDLLVHAGIADDMGNGKGFYIKPEWYQPPG